MSTVSAPTEHPPDLIDLRFLPAWVKQESTRYSDFEGEDAPDQFRPPREQQHRVHQRRGERRGKPRRDERAPRRERRDRPVAQREQRNDRPFVTREHRAEPEKLPELTVAFLPQTSAFENVAAQIKNATAAFSLYALARLFLQKPERYRVRLTAPETQPAFFRLSESSVIGGDRAALEASAFRLLRQEYYQSEVTLSDPVKGNFSSVARERSTGTLLGPTNHHEYQPQLRRFYEQRFSRRMSFPDFQRQIEIVSDPALVEQWKEEARKVTKFTTRREQAPQTFHSEQEAERHFREKHLPGLVLETREAEIDGVSSRQLRDRGFARVIENAWAAEERSPSKMMQELSGRFRAAGLHIFRHRKGMLFVSPIRPKPIEESSVSDSVRTILETMKTSPRITRKELATKLLGESGNEDARMKLASDLRWLVREGHVLEFNDGSLDLPRVKAKEPSSSPAEANATVEKVPASGTNPVIETSPAAAPELPHPVDYSPTTLSEGSIPV